MTERMMIVTDSIEAERESKFVFADFRKTMVKKSIVQKAQIVIIFFITLFWMIK